MKENRTYDQVLGDLGKGNGDPSLAIFGQNVTPNQHELSSRFVTFDNFYADAEVSADGWSLDQRGERQHVHPEELAAGLQRLRAADLGLRRVRRTPRPPGSPEKGYLWDDLARNGVSFRNFGFFMDNPAVVPASMPGLVGHTDLKYPGWDLLLTDQARIDRWLARLPGLRATGVDADGPVRVPAERSHLRDDPARPEAVGLHGGQRPSLGRARRRRVALLVLAAPRRSSPSRTTRRTVPTTSTRTVRRPT